MSNASVAERETKAATARTLPSGTDAAGPCVGKATLTDGRTHLWEAKKKFWCGSVLRGAVAAFASLTTTEAGAEADWSRKW